MQVALRFTQEIEQSSLKSLVNTLDDVGSNLSNADRSADTIFHKYELADFFNNQSVR